MQRRSSAGKLRPFNERLERRSSSSSDRSVRLGDHIDGHQTRQRQTTPETSEGPSEGASEGRTAREPFGNKFELPL